MNLYGIIGNPIAQSKSPRMWNYVFENMGIDALYIPMSLPLEYENKQITLSEKIVRENFSGFNIAEPFKGSVAQEKLVSCVSINQYGYNDFYNVDKMAIDKLFDIKPENKVLIFGSGSVALSAAISCFERDCQNVVVVCVSPNSQIRFYNEIGYHFGKNDYEKEAFVLSNKERKKIKFIEYCNFIEHSEFMNFRDFDFIFQTTSIGSDSDKEVFPASFLNLKENCIALELNHLFERTDFINKIEDENGTVISGEDFLVAQAMQSFEIWFDKSPDPYLFYQGLLKG